MVDLPVSQKICQIFETTSYRLYIGSCQTCNSGCFQSKGWEAAKNTDLHVDSVYQVSRAAWTACWYLSWASWAIRKWKKWSWTKKTEKNKQPGDSKWPFFKNFYLEDAFTFEADISTYQKKTPRIARNIGSIIFSFSGSTFLMVFLFDISRLRSLAIDQWVVCTHILKEPWNLFKKIANRQYHIHIIQHLWYLRNKNQVRFMLNNLLQRLQTWQPTLGHFWKDSLHFRLKWAVQHLQKKDFNHCNSMSYWATWSYQWSFEFEAKILSYLVVAPTQLKNTSKSNWIISPQNIPGEKNKSFKPPLRTLKWSILFREQPLIFYFLTTVALNPPTSWRKTTPRITVSGGFGVRQVNRITFGPFGPWIKWRHWA